MRLMDLLREPCLRSTLIAAVQPVDGATHGISAVIAMDCRRHQVFAGQPSGPQSRMVSDHAWPDREVIATRPGHVAAQRTRV